MKVYFIENPQVPWKQLTSRQINAIKAKNIKVFIYTPSEWGYTMLYSLGNISRFVVTQWATVTSALGYWRKRIGWLTTINTSWLSYSITWENLLSFAREKYVSQEHLNADIQSGVAQ